MGGVPNAHNFIAPNTTGAPTRLRGRPCRPLNSDTKIRARPPTQVRCHYPDVSVVCRPNLRSGVLEPSRGEKASDKPGSGARLAR
jgi:hypothetical protein